MDWLRKSPNLFLKGLCIFNQWKEKACKLAGSSRSSNLTPSTPRNNATPKTADTTQRTGTTRKIPGSSQVYIFDSSGKLFEPCVYSNIFQDFPGDFFESNFKLNNCKTSWNIQIRRASGFYHFCATICQGDEVVFSNLFHFDNRWDVVYLELKNCFQRVFLTNIVKFFGAAW